MTPPPATHPPATRPAATLSVASLPMYDLPAIRWATDALWSAIGAKIARRGIAAPAALDRRADHAAVWHEPGLLLSQTCGYPFVMALKGTVRLVATPLYAAPGCREARYSSVMIVREDEPARSLEAMAGRRAAMNAADSQSGMNALRAAAAPFARYGRFFGGVAATGSHAASIAAVREGRADIAAIDCVTWALTGHHLPAAVAGLRILGFTADAPALPYVTAAARSDREVEELRDTLMEVAADPTLEAARTALMIEGFRVLDEGAYREIARMEEAAARAGYPDLR